VEGRVALRATRERVDSPRQLRFITDAAPPEPRRSRDRIWCTAWAISVLAFLVHVFAQMRMRVPIV